MIETAVCLWCKKELPQSADVFGPAHVPLCIDHFLQIGEDDIAMLLLRFEPYDMADVFDYARLDDWFLGGDAGQRVHDLQSFIEHSDLALDEILPRLSAPDHAGYF